MKRSTVSVETIKQSADTGPVLSDAELLNFLKSRGVTTLQDAFKLGRLDLACEVLVGSYETVKVSVKR